MIRYCMLVSTIHTPHTDLRFSDSRLSHAGSKTPAGGVI